MSSLLIANQIFLPCSVVFAEPLSTGSLTIAKEVQDEDKEDLFTFRVKLKGKDVKDGDYKIKRAKNQQEDDVDPNRKILRQGVSGTIKWTIDDKGVLFFEPVSGDEGTFADSQWVGLGDPDNGYEWSEERAGVTQIKSRGKINLAKNSSYMFETFSSLKNIDALKNWNTKKVTDMSEMFSGCSSLITVELSNTNKNIVSELPTEETSTLSSKWHKVGTTQEYTPDELIRAWRSSFEGTWSREKISSDSWDDDGGFLALFTRPFARNNNKNYSDRSSSSWNDDWVFPNENFPRGISGTVSWKIYNGTLYLEPVSGDEGTFGDSRGSDYSSESRNGYIWNKYGSSILRVKTRGTLHLNEHSSYMFWNCINLKEIDLGNFKTDKAITIDGMFYNCRSLKTVYFRNFYTNHITDMSWMFKDCSSLENLDLSNFNTRQVTDMYGMFEGCSSLENLDLSNFDTRNVTNKKEIFDGCSSLKTINLSVDSYSIISSLPTNETTTLSSKWHKVGTSKDYNLYDMEFHWGYTAAGRWSREKQQTYTIHFDTNGTYEELDNITAKKGEYVNLPTPSYSPSGKHFVGQSKYRNGSVISSTRDLASAGETITLYAVWKDSTYTIHFDTNGDVTVKEGETVTPPTPPTHPTGKYFIGWSKTPDGKIVDKYKDIAKPGEAITLYPVWKDLDSTVTVTNGEFTVVIPAGESITIENLPVGTTYEVEELTKDGWVVVKEENSTGVIEINKNSKTTFTNHHDITKTNAKIFATALLDGKPAAGFVFDLYKDGTKVDSATSLNDGTVVFHSLVFDSSGDYTYQIKASDTTNPNYQYDNSTKTVTVNVTNTYKGTLSAEADKKPTFTNTTKQGTLTVQKVVKNNTQNDQLFTFSLKVDDQIQTFQLHAGEKKSFNLPYGTKYELKETNLPAYYSQDSFTNTSGTINNDNSSITAVSTSRNNKPILPTTGTIFTSLTVLFLLGTTVLSIRKRKQLCQQS